MYGYRHSIIDAQNREIASRNRAISYSALLDDNWDADITRGFGLIEDENIDWSDFAAPEKLYEELDGLEEDFPF